MNTDLGNSVTPEEIIFATSSKLHRSPTNENNSPQLSSTPDTQYKVLRSGKRLEILQIGSPTQTSATLSTPNNLKQLESEITEVPIVNCAETVFQFPVNNPQTPNSDYSTPQQKPKNKMSNQTAEDIYTKIINTLPEFSGNDSRNPSSDLIDFILRAEWARANMIKETNRHIFDQVIQFKLVGDARRKTQGKNIRDFETLKQTLHTLYSTTKSLEELRRDCFTCQQRHIETIAEFGQRLINALDEYTSGFEVKYKIRPNEASIKDLMDQAMLTFKKGLNNPRLRREVQTTRMDSLEDLVREAVLIEKLIVDTDDGIHGNSMNQQPFSTSTPIIQYQLQKPKANITCNYCNKPNHVWKECRSRLMQQNAVTMPPNLQFHKTNSTQYQQNSAGHYNNFCVYCKRSGHNVLECRTKRANENRQYNMMQDATMPLPPRNAPSFKFEKQPQNNPWTHNRTPLPQTQYNQYNNQDNFRPIEQKICQYCKRTGHRIDECRTRQNEQSRYKQNLAPSNLEDQFGKMKIFNINQYNAEDFEIDNNSGNDQGSGEN